MKGHFAVSQTLAVVTQTLPRDDGMAGDHWALEAGEFFKVRIRGHNKELPKMQRFRSGPGQNEMQVSCVGWPQALRKEFFVMPILGR